MKTNITILNIARSFGSFFVEYIDGNTGVKMQVSDIAINTFWKQSHYMPNIPYSFVIRNYITQNS